MNNHNAYNLTKPFKKGLSRTIIFLIVSMMGIGNAWADTWDGTITNNANNNLTNNNSIKEIVEINKKNNSLKTENEINFNPVWSIVSIKGNAL